MKIIYFILGFIGLIILVSVMWRFLSRYINLPCPAWLRWLVELDNPFAKVAHAQTVVEHLALTPGMRVLDVGCGTGRITIPIAEKVGPTGHVTALDVQHGMLESVQEKVQAKNLHNVRLLKAGIGNSALEHNYYDRAILVTVLGEIPIQHQYAALQEIFNVLKPGGILLVTEMIFDPHFQSQTMVAQVAQMVGFRHKETIGRWFAYTMQFEKP